MKLILIFIAVATLNLTEATFCRCVPNDTLKKEFNETAFIVHGKVINIETVQSHLLKVTLEIIQSYKGKTTDKIITIYTYNSAVGCGYTEFEKGKEFISFLSQRSAVDAKIDELDEKMIFWTTRCTLTGLYDKEIESELCTLIE